MSRGRFSHARMQTVGTSGKGMTMDVQSPCSREASTGRVSISDVSTSSHPNKDSSVCVYIHIYILFDKTITCLQL